jgi:hypothetical protein
MKEWNRPLFLTAILHTLLVAAFFIFSLFDHRTVLGLEVWLKPMKFALSIAVYTISLSWLVSFVQSRTASRQIALWTVVGLCVETTLITIQAARGTKSHYNIEDPFGITVYIIMGIFIGIVTIMLVWLAVELARRPPKQWSKLQLTSVQMGLWLTVIGTLIGGWMSSKTGHSVGGADGGEGLLFLNWSTKLGDYRVSHFMGLHALQVFVMLGLWFNRLRYGRVYIWISFLLYTFLLGLVLYLTMQAKSVVSW